MTLIKALAPFAVAGLLAATVLAGCDRPPSPPKTAEGEMVRQVTVSPANRDELAAATAVKAAKVNYLYRLQVLEGYYDRIGNMDKLIWTRHEMENLQGAQTFTWEGLPDVLAPEGESIEGADERLLAEYVVAARQEYLDAVASLEDYYIAAGQDFKAGLVANMQQRFDPLRTYMYFLSAEVPPADLQPTAVIPEADAMFAEALKLHEQGKGILHMALTTDYDKQRQALVKFRQLIAEYPTSARIAEAAYYIGDIYKEYFNENIRAVLWYERAWQWDPNITKPARFQAATVYDFRLHNDEKAVDLYRQAIQHEQFNASNVRYSQQRISELSGR